MLYENFLVCNKLCLVAREISVTGRMEAALRQSTGRTIDLSGIMSVCLEIIQLQDIETYNVRGLMSGCETGGEPDDPEDMKRQGYARHVLVLIPRYLNW